MTGIFAATRILELSWQQTKQEQDLLKPKTSGKLLNDNVVTETTH
jgi:hypothetical protein